MHRSLRIRLYEWALKNGYFVIASGLIGNRTSAESLLLPTVQAGTENLLRKLLLSGAKVDSTHLLIDARNSKIEPRGKMKVLIQAGLDPNGFVGPRRLKLVNYAILNRDEEFFHFLMDQNVDTQTADRNDLLPIQAAQMMEAESIKKVLTTFSGSDNPSHVLRLLESLVINENMLYSELHELLKWCFKNSGFDLIRTTLPQTGLIRYRIRRETAKIQIDLRVELRFIANQEITLLLFRGEAVLPLQSLLPSAGKIDSKTLRGHVVTELKEFAAHAENGSTKRKIEDEPIPTVDGKALKTLGLEEGAADKEIIAAYRALAKNTILT